MRLNNFSPVVALTVVVMMAILVGAIWWRFSGFNQVVIINLGNLQSQLLSFEEVSDDGLTVNQRGGVTRIATMIAATRKKHPNALLVSPGDLVMGTWWRTYGGEPEFKVANLLGVDVGMVGTYELKLGTEHLKKALSYPDYPILASNLSFADQQLAENLSKRLLVETKDGSLVAFFSLSPATMGCQACPTEVKVDDQYELLVADNVEYFRRKKAKAIIMLSQASPQDDTKLARRVKGLSLIINGESNYHSVAGISWVSGPGGWMTPVVTSEDYGRELSVIKLDLQRGRPRPQTTEFDVLPVTGKLAISGDMLDLISDYVDQMELFFSQRIGSTSVPLDARESILETRETAVGNFLADALRWNTGADVAVFPSSGIRGNRIFPGGPVTMKTLTTLLPFQNTIWVKTMTGAQIRQMLELSASSLMGFGDNISDGERLGRGDFLQVSGLRFTIALGLDNSPAEVDAQGNIINQGHRVNNIEVLSPGYYWEALDDRARYQVAMPSFLANSNSRRYSFIKKISGKDTEEVAVEAVADYLRIRPGARLFPETSGRIEILNLDVRGDQSLSFSSDIMLDSWAF